MTVKALTVVVEMTYWSQNSLIFWRKRKKQRNKRKILKLFLKGKVLEILIRLKNHKLFGLYRFLLWNRSSLKSHKTNQTTLNKLAPTVITKPLLWTSLVLLYNSKKRREFSLQILQLQLQLSLIIELNNRVVLILWNILQILKEHMRNKKILYLLQDRYQFLRSDWRWNHQER